MPFKSKEQQAAVMSRLVQSLKKQLRPTPAWVGGGYRVLLDPAAGKAVTNRMWHDLDPRTFIHSDLAQRHFPIGKTKVKRLIATHGYSDEGLLVDGNYAFVPVSASSTRIRKAWQATDMTKRERALIDIINSRLAAARRQNRKR